MHMTSWLFEGKDVTEPVEGMAGFVYEVVNERNGMIYIGKKKFWSDTKRKVVAKSKTKDGKKKMKTKRVKKESDWKRYYGSSERLKADIKQYGQGSFSRRILRFCRSAADLNYYELREQLLRDALLDPNYYNGIINVRISKNQIKEPLENFEQGKRWPES